MLLREQDVECADYWDSSWRPYGSCMKEPHCQGDSTGVWPNTALTRASAAFRKL